MCNILNLFNNKVSCQVNLSKQKFPVFPPYRGKQETYFRSKLRVGKMDYFEQLAKAFNDRMAASPPDCGGELCARAICRCGQVEVREVCPVLCWCWGGQGLVMRALPNTDHGASIRLPSALLVCDDIVYQTLKMLGWSDRDIYWRVRRSEVVHRPVGRRGSL